MKNEPAPPLRPAVEHAPPVAHDEGDETLLARWLWKAMEQGPRFWLMLAGLVALTLALLLLVNALTAGDTVRSAGWEELFQAKGAEAMEKVAEAYPKSPAATWARLQAAGGRFQEGTAKLATDRTGAKPLLKKALDEFQEVADSAPKDSPEARLAALGVARTLEARNELADAIAQYRKVAADWPGTDEAASAAKRADLLGTPEAVEFYKSLYAYKAPETTLPPGGKEIFNLPNLNLPSTGGIGVGGPADPLNGLPPPLPEPPAITPPATPGSAPAPAEGESKAAEPKADEKAAEPKAGDPTAEKAAEPKATEKAEPVATPSPR